MSQQDGNSRRPGSVTSSQSDKPGATSRMFRSILAANNIIMDLSGDAMPSELRELVDTRIRKSRSPPRLSEEQLAAFVKEVIRVWDKPETIVSDITKTSAFTIDRSDIAEGRGNLWQVKPLPKDPEYPYSLPLPKPDRSYGYHTGQESKWSITELAVVDHREALPYSQPSKEVLFPFYMIEMKSEASGGTLYVAENQAANSGTQSVRGRRWLHSQANPSGTLSVTDAIAFTAAISQRMAVLHVHWYCPEKEKYYMSYIDCFRLQKPSDVLEYCHHHLNIQDFGGGDLQHSTRALLKALYPIPKHWKKGRSTSAIADAAESFVSEDGRSSKSQRI